MSTQAVALEPQVDPKLYLGILRRRLLYLIAPAVVVFVAACGLAYLLPPVYEATAKVLVESQQIRADLAAPTVVASASERLQVIQQRLMTRDNLLSVARKFELYPFDRAQLSPTDLVARMQSATQIELLDLDALSQQSGAPPRAARQRQNDTAIAFTVAFDYYDPETSARVANQFVDYILQQNLESRTSRAAETSKFFDQQIADYNKKLTDLEAQILDFKKKNEMALPDTLAYRESTLTQLQMEANAVDRQIDQLRIVDQQQRQTLTDQLALAKRQLSDMEDERNSVGPLAKKGFFPQNKVQEFDRKIVGLQADVQRITSQIDNQKNELGENGRQTADLQVRRTDLAKRISELSDGIMKTPAVETEFKALTRNYEVLQQQMHDAQAKMAFATTGEQLEQDRQAERFEVIEQATVPDQPKKPNRPKILLAGGFGSIAIGVGFVVLLEMLDRSVRTSADIERLLQLRPISVIPYVVTAAEQRRRQLRTLLSWFVVAALVALSIFLAVTFLPVDALYERLANKIHFILGR
jgi:uncharacterized protein involved in exopolysaccharide biosynthesis